MVRRDPVDVVHRVAGVHVGSDSRRVIRDRRERVGGVGDAVVVGVGVQIVRSTVTVGVTGSLCCIGDAIAIGVGILEVRSTVAVGIARTFRGVGDSVAVGVGVQGVRRSVPVGVTGAFSSVRDSIAVVVGVGVVASPVAVGVGVLARVERERVGSVRCAITVVIGVGVIADAVAVSVGVLARVERERVGSVRGAVVVVVGVGDIQVAVAVRVGRGWRRDVLHIATVGLVGSGCLKTELSARSSATVEDHEGEFVRARQRQLVGDITCRDGIGELNTDQGVIKVDP